MYLAHKKGEQMEKKKNPKLLPLRWYKVFSLPSTWHGIQSIVFIDYEHWSVFSLFGHFYVNGYLRPISSYSLISTNFLFYLLPRIEERTLNKLKNFQQVIVLFNLLSKF